MPTMQIRGVSEETSRRLKARASAAGQSLSEYLLIEVNRLAQLPTLEELTERIRELGPTETSVTAADVLAAERAERSSDG